MEYTKVINLTTATNATKAATKVKGNPMFSATDPAYITTKEAAKRAGVTLKTIHRWMRDGLFTWKRKDRKNILVNEAEFERYLAELTAPISQSSP